MPSVDVINSDNEVVDKVQLDERAFDSPVKPYLVHEVVRYQLAKRRAGTASTRNRALVAGSRRKPWRQKGTGRARAGSRQSPLWRGGGVVFGPQPRDYSFKLNRKVRKAALRSVLTQRLREGHLKVIDKLELPEIRTKRMAELLRRLGLDNVLIVTPGRDEVIERSARNIPGVKVLPVEGINVYDVLRYRELLVLKDALPEITERVVS